MYKALDEGYLDSKFILTVREKQSWLRSCQHLWERRLHRSLAGMPDVPFRRYITLINETVYSTDMFNEKTFSAVYDAYVADALRYFANRRRDLLVLDICAGAGWNELCEFLEIKQNVRSVFPHCKYPDFRQPLPA